MTPKRFSPTWRDYEQVLAQLDVESPFAAQALKHASRGVSAVPQSEQRASEMPHVERQLDVLSLLLMQAS